MHYIVMCTYYDWIVSYILMYSLPAVGGERQYVFGYAISPSVVH